MDFLNDFCKEYFVMWKNATNFTDRTNIKGYWMAFLVNFIIIAILGLIGQFILRTNLLNYVYGAAVLIPGIAVTIRRLNDTGKEWYWILVGIIPIIGFFLDCVAALSTFDSRQRSSYDIVSI